MRFLQEALTVLKLYIDAYEKYHYFVRRYNATPALWHCMEKR